MRAHEHQMALITSDCVPFTDAPREPDLRCFLGPGGCTAFCSDYNSNILTHPARDRPVPVLQVLQEAPRLLGQRPARAPAGQGGQALRVLDMRRRVSRERSIS